MDNILTNPVVAVVMCQNRMNGHLVQTVHEKYLNVLVNTGAIPLTLPPMLTERQLSQQIIPRIDGILLPGSPSNIQPYLYGENSTEEHIDPGRDQLSMLLVELAVKRAIPLLGICRGLQEINVGMGGKLYSKLHQQPGFIEHRENQKLSIDEQYAPSHQVMIEPGGLLAKLLADVDTYWVNSLHGQGIKQLGKNLIIEARAPDQLIEAVSIKNHPFALGVQWHPEWQMEQNIFSRKIFSGFIEACRLYRQRI